MKRQRVWRKLAALAAGGVLIQAQLTACTQVAGSYAYAGFNPAASFPGWYIIGSLLGIGPCGDPSDPDDDLFVGCPTVP